MLGNEKLWEKTKTDSKKDLSNKNRTGVYGSTWEKRQQNQWKISSM